MADPTAVGSAHPTGTGFGSLGLGTRLKEGPAPELVQSAGRLETSDSAILWREMSLADLAHVVMLVEVGIVPAESGGRLLELLLELHALPVEQVALDPVLGDLYSNREHWVSRRDSEAAGWLSAGRARREASTVAYRLAVRHRLLALGRAMDELIQATLGRAATHVDTLMPDYTYLQQAHPTTLGHYLLSFVYPMLRDLDRLQACFQRTNTSAAGVGSINGSRLPLDRERLAELLAFEDVITNARDAMWQVDGPVELMATVVALLVNLDRLAEDLMIWTTQEFALVDLADRHSRASVIMPQKKNPYSLAYVRGVAGLAIGRLASMASVAKTPSAQVDNRIFAHGEVPRTLDLTIDSARLMAGVIGALSVNTRLMAQRALDGYAQATDLAEVLMREGGIPYRDAHRVVGVIVRLALERGLPMREVHAELIDEAARPILGRPLALAAEVVAEAVDPARIVASRIGTGGAAPEPMRRMLIECRDRLLAAQQWHATAGAALARAEHNLLARATTLAGRRAGNGTRPRRGGSQP